MKNGKVANGKAAKKPAADDSSSEEEDSDEVQCTKTHRILLNAISSSILRTLSILQISVVYGS